MSFLRWVTEPRFPRCSVIRARSVDQHQLCRWPQDNPKSVSVPGLGPNQKTGVALSFQVSHKTGYRQFLQIRGLILLFFLISKARVDALHVVVADIVAETSAQLIFIEYDDMIYNLLVVYHGLVVGHDWVELAKDWWSVGLPGGGGFQLGGATQE